MPFVQDLPKYGLIDFAPKSAAVVNYTGVPSKEELETRQFPNATQEHLLIPQDLASFGKYPDLPYGSEVVLFDGYLCVHRDRVVFTRHSTLRARTIRTGQGMAYHVRDRLYYDKKKRRGNPHKTMFWAKLKPSFTNQREEEPAEDYRSPSRFGQEVIEQGLGSDLDGGDEVDLDGKNAEVEDEIDLEEGQKVQDECVKTRRQGAQSLHDVSPQSKPRRLVPQQKKDAVGKRSNHSRVEKKRKKVASKADTSLTTANLLSLLRERPKEELDPASRDLIRELISID